MSNNPRIVAGSEALFTDHRPSGKRLFGAVMTEAKKHLTLQSDGVNNESEEAFRARTPTARTAAAVQRDLSMRTAEDDATLHEIHARTAQLLDNMRRGRA